MRRISEYFSKCRLGAVAFVLVPLLWAGDIDAQTARTTTYKYDALGRLTYAEDSLNGNRDYDYDAAGTAIWRIGAPPWANSLGIGYHYISIEILGVTSEGFRRSRQKHRDN